MMACNSETNAYLKKHVIIDPIRPKNKIAILLLLTPLCKLLSTNENFQFAKHKDIKNSQSLAFLHPTGSKISICIRRLVKDGYKINQVSSF